MSERFPWTPPLSLWTLAIALAALACRSQAPPASAAPRAVFIPHVLRTADGRAVTGEMGRLQVPENRDRPGSRTIDLAFMRVKSTAPNPGPPIILVEGGPGLSSIENLGLRLYPLLPALRAVADVVAFDQRGVGLTRPALDCPERWDLPLDAGWTRETFLAVARERSRSCRAYWISQGVDLSAYHTNASADDIDALRAALGADRVSLLGGSYGSHLILAAVRRHGPRIHRIVLNGTEGPDHTLKLPTNVQKQLETIATLVAADPGMRALVPDLLSLVRTVIGRLERTPITADVVDPAGGERVTVTMTAFALRLVTAQGLGSTAFIRELPGTYYDMAHGDFSWLAKALAAMSRQPFRSAMASQMDCASGVSETRAARIRQEAAGTILGDVTDLPFLDVCDAWVPNDLGPGFRGPLQSNVPALFISGTVDGRTPVSNAEEVRAGFPNSAQIIVENAGHGDRDLLVSPPGVSDAVVAFLVGQPVTTTRSALPPLRFTRPATAKVARP